MPLCQVFSLFRPVCLSLVLLTLNQSAVCAQQSPLRPAITSSSASAASASSSFSSSSNSSSRLVSSRVIRTDEAMAKKMARNRWLDKMVAADPSLVAALCTHASSARILAAHPHIDKIAESDHYTCRRITKWGSASNILAKNPKALRVVTLDPEGLYRAIRHDRSMAHKISKNQFFDQMIVENPDLGKMLASYM
jgi:hypothetical protein